MASQVSICNQALLRLGANTITNINQDTTEARICLTYYADTLKAVLEEYAWSFAVKRYELPKSAEVPPKPFAAKFLIPSNVIRILEASSDPNFLKANSTEWEVEGEFILSNHGSLFIRAVNDISDTRLFSPGFTRSVILRLASEMCNAIVQSREMQGQLLEEYASVLTRAISADAQQGRSRVMRSDQLITVRAKGTTLAGPYV